MKSKVDQDYNNSKELKKSHSFISTKKKQKLIDLVVQTHMTIYKAAKRLNICHPTAKFIVKNYRKSQEFVRQTKNSLEDVLVQNQVSSPKNSEEIQKDNSGNNSLNSIANQQIRFLEISAVFPQMWMLYSQSSTMQPLYYYF